MKRNIENRIRVKKCNKQNCVGELDLCTMKKNNNKTYIMLRT